MTGRGETTVVQEINDSTMSSVPWRKTGAKYSNNEIYFDIIEEIDSIVDRSDRRQCCTHSLGSNGQVVMLEVHGDIMVPRSPRVSVRYRTGERPTFWNARPQSALQRSFCSA